MAQRIFLLLLFFFFLLLPSFVSANVVDRSVAVVNEDTITLSEVNELGKPFFQKVTEETPVNQLNEALQQARKVVIDKLIDKKLLVQEAKKLNLRVSDEEVENALQRILANNKKNIEQFRQEIGSMGLNEKQYREDLREQILSSKLINYEVRSKVIIPEEKIIDYYDNHYTEQLGSGSYYILQIGCTWGSKNRNGVTQTQPAAKAKVEKAHELAVKGEDFKELARKYSDLPSAGDGGDLGTFQANEIAAYMRDAITSLKPGEISPIIESDNGYQFFKLVSSETGKIIAKAPYKAVRDEIQEKLYQQEMAVRFKDWLKSIRDKAYIKIL
jgi:peptidyl-prolyl cis-trans isomerase SurA